MMHVWNKTSERLNSYLACLRVSDRLNGYLAYLRVI